MATAHDEAKWSAYPNTLLEFPERHSTTIDLRKPLDDTHRALLHDLGLTRPFAVITAENPSGLNAEDAADEREAAIRERNNRQRTAQLYATVEKRECYFIPVDGVSPDGVYREHSLAIIMERGDAVDLARDLDQLAIFWYDGRDFWLDPAEVDQEPERLPARARVGPLEGFATPS